MPRESIELDPEHRDVTHLVVGLGHEATWRDFTPLEKLTRVIPELHEGPTRTPPDVSLFSAEVAIALLRGKNIPQESVATPHIPKPIAWLRGLRGSFLVQYLHARAPRS